MNPWAVIRKVVGDGVVFKGAGKSGRRERGWRVLCGWAHSLVKFCCVGFPTAVEQRPPTPFQVVEFPSV
jgi:hypothetical protein